MTKINNYWDRRSEEVFEEINQEETKTQKDINSMGREEVINYLDELVSSL